MIFVVVAGCEIWGIHISDAWLKVLFVIVAFLLTFCLYLGHSAMVLLNGLDERCNEWIESITENAESVGGLGQIKKLGKGK